MSWTERFGYVIGPWLGLNGSDMPLTPIGCRGYYLGLAMKRAGLYSRAEKKNIC